MSVNRCYSEKKPGFDVEARSLFSSLHDLLEVKSLTHVRYLCRYDTEGLAPEAYEKSQGIVFSEPMADVCYDEDFPRPAGAPYCACRRADAWPVRSAGGLLCSVHSVADRW